MRFIDGLKIGLMATLFALAAACSGGSAGGGGTTATDAGATTDAGAATDAGGGQADAGSSTGDVAGGGCGAVTDKGVCKGDKLSYCANGKLEESDCVALMKELGAGTCMEVSKDWGGDCALKTGGSCLWEDEAGDLVWEFCAGDKGACLDQPDGVLCQTGVDACVEADIDTCMGDLGILDCSGGLPYALDCKAWSGKCALVDKAPVCTEIAVDGDCNGEDLRCADGLSCEGITDDTLGTCTKK